MALEVRRPRISVAKRLKALEEENRKLKKLLAEQMLDAATLREMLGKNSDAQFPEDGRDLGRRAEELLSGGRAGLPAWHPRPTAAGPVVATMPGCAGGCASWPPSGVASTTGAC